MAELHSLKDAVAAIKKKSGKEAHSMASDVPDFPRLPTGILPLDFNLAGGIPMGAVSIFYGPEGAGKSSLALRCAASFQKRHPKKEVVYLDIENALEQKWAAEHGVDTKKMHTFRPTTAEEAADMTKEIVLSEDAGLLIVDSLAALTSIPQFEKSAEEVVVAGAAKPSTTLLRNVQMGLVEHVKAHERLTVIYINQVRTKIGFVMGNPEILPGPVMQNYQAFLKLRVTGRPILKEKIAPIPIYSENTARIAKKKFPAIRESSKWETILYPHQGLKPLTVNNAKHMDKLLTELDLLTNEGKDGWLLHTSGEVFPTKTAAVEWALDHYDDTLHDMVHEALLLFKDEDE